MSPSSRVPVGATIAIVSLLAAVVGLQALRDRMHPGTLRDVAGANVLYVQSPAVVTRAALSYRSLLADVYWIRALQHYGRTALSDTETGRYDLLFPLLDLTTSLDPKFTIAYRFGSIFLTEPPPSGPGRADLAIALLQKGLASQPHRWEYAQDIGFVHYRVHDYPAAADWFRRAAAIPGAPSWMAPLEAVTRARGGDRQTARLLWTTIAGSEEAWLRSQAEFRLRQLNAMDQIDRLEHAARLYQQRSGSWPRAWRALGFPEGQPADPEGFMYRLNPFTGAVTLDPASTVNPLPVDERPVAR
jgi:hypothetical protein